MNVTMSINTLLDLMSQYEQIGIMQAVKAYEPTEDLVRETQIKAWLTLNGIDLKTFKLLVKLGVLKAERNGTAKNSPLCYSKKAIKTAMAAWKVKLIIRQQAEVANAKAE